MRAVRCAACGAGSFPPGDWCRVCSSPDVSSWLLASEGRIEACAVFDGNAFAEIRLDDGMLVGGRIEPAERASVGARVRFAPRDGIVEFTA